MTNAIVECGIIIPANIGCWAEYQCNKGYHIQLNIQDIISYYVQLLDEHFSIHLSLFIYELTISIYVNGNIMSTFVCVNL